ADVSTRQYLIDSPRRDKPGRPPIDDEEAARRKALEHAKLQRMVEYADTGACLRATILQYFGDPAARDRCEACGNCQPRAIDGYEREMVRTLLAGIVAAGERYGRFRIVALLAGDTQTLPSSLARLPAAGSLRGHSSDAISRWIDAAIAAGLIAVSKDQYRT